MADNRAGRSIYELTRHVDTDRNALGDAGRASLAAAGVRVREEPVRRLTATTAAWTGLSSPPGPSRGATRCSYVLGADNRTGWPRRSAAGGTIVTDGDGRTTVAGVYAAGDAATDRLRSVAAAIGTGSRAALAAALDHMAVASLEPGLFSCRPPAVHDAPS